MSLERNIRLYPWYKAVFSAYFWLPVFFLYFSSKFSIAQVLELEAVYYAAVVALEVPSGYFSDSVGRRITLLIAPAGVTVAHGFFLIGESFGSFALAQVCLAMGLAFNSGTDTSFHYDSLAGLGRETQFGEREAVAAHHGFLGSACAGLVGGLAATLDLRYAYGLAFAGGCTALTIVLLTMEPGTLEKRASLGKGLAHQLRLCIRYLKRPALAWLFLFYILMTVLNHVPYEFYQPYLSLVFKERSVLSQTTPLVSGVVSALTMLVAARVAANSTRLQDRLGLAPCLLLAAALQTAIIVAMAAVLNPVIILLILLRSCPRALMTTPINAAIAPQVPQAQRATYLSLQSLAGRLSFSGVLFVLARVAGTDSAVTPDTLTRFLAIAGVLGLAGTAALAATSRALRRDAPQR